MYRKYVGKSWQRFRNKSEGKEVRSKPLGVYVWEGIGWSYGAGRLRPYINL